MPIEIAYLIIAALCFLLALAIWALRTARRALESCYSLLESLWPNTHVK